MLINLQELFVHKCARSSDCSILDEESIVHTRKTNIKGNSCKRETDMLAQIKICAALPLRCIEGSHASMATRSIQRYTYTYWHITITFRCNPRCCRRRTWIPIGATTPRRNIQKQSLYSGIRQKYEAQRTKSVSYVCKKLGRLLPQG